MHFSEREENRQNKRKEEKKSILIVSLSVAASQPSNWNNEARITEDFQ